MKLEPVPFYRLHNTGRLYSTALCFFLLFSDVKTPSQKPSRVLVKIDLSSTVLSCGQCCGSGIRIHKSDPAPVKLFVQKIVAEKMDMWNCVVEYV